MIVRYHIAHWPLYWDKFLGGRALSLTYRDYIIKMSTIDDFNYIEDGRIHYVIDFKSQENFFLFVMKYS